MDDLINKWRKTVDNHNQKLQNIRDSSLGASSSGKQKIISQKESLDNEPRGRQQPPQTTDQPPFNLEGLNPQQSELSKQPFSNQEHLVLNDLEVLKDGKENMSVNKINTDKPSQNILVAETEEEELDQDLKFFAENILSQVFQDTKLKSKKQKQILEVLQENPQIAAYLSKKKKQEKRALSLEYDLKMSQVDNNEISSKISELERQLHKSQVEVTLLDSQIEEAQRKIVDGDQCAQESGIEVLKYGIDQLKESQGNMQKANQQITQSIDQERANFEEKEQIWRQQFKELQELIEQTQ